MNLFCLSLNLYFYLKYLIQILLILKSLFSSSKDKPTTSSIGYRLCSRSILFRALQTIRPSNRHRLQPKLHHSVPKHCSKPTLIPLIRMHSRRRLESTANRSTRSGRTSRSSPVRSGRCVQSALGFRRIRSRSCLKFNMSIGRTQKVHQPT